MSDEAERELREIREKMERGELNPRARPEPTPDQRRKISDKWKKMWDDIYAAIERDLLRHLGDDPGLPLGWEGVEPVEGDEEETGDHYLDHLWALHLIQESGCRVPEGER